MFQQVVGQVCRAIDRRGSAARQRGCKKGFRGRYHARTMKTNQKKIGVTACNQGRYTDWRPNLLHGMSTAVFVGSRTVDSLLPPASLEWSKETLCPGVDTHTHIRICGCLWHEVLNQYSTNYPQSCHSRVWWRFVVFVACSAWNQVPLIGLAFFFNGFGPPLDQTQWSCKLDDCRPK